jgi:hypothetical protein
LGGVLPGDRVDGALRSLDVGENVIEGWSLQRVEIGQIGGLLSDSEAFDGNMVLYLVRRYAGRCTSAIRVVLVVRVLVVVAVSVSLPWVT